jgi:hypothetical protein
MRSIRQASALLLLISSAAMAQAPDTAAVIRSAREVALATVREIESAPTRRLTLRGSAAKSAGDLRRAGPETEQLLLETLAQRDSSHLTRSAAAYGLYLADADRVDTVVAVLIQEMNRTAFSNTRIAQSLILAIGRPAVPTLLKHTENAMVLNLLGAMGAEAESAVPALKEQLGTENTEVAATLAAIGTAEAVNAAKPVLVHALSDPTSPDMRMVLAALGSLRSRARDAVPVIQAVIEKGTPEARLYAAVALADVGVTDPASRELGRLLSDQSIENRYPALQKLAELGPRAKAAVPALLRVVEDTSDTRLGERADAAAALQRIAPGDPRVRTTLKNAANDPRLREEMEGHKVNIRR